MSGMVAGAFNTLVYEPLYNALVLLIEVVPYADVGVAVILLTIFVKLVLFPLSLKAVRTQMALRAMEPELKALKEKHKNNQQAQAQAMMALYRKYHINPFSSILLILLQLPIIFGLYWVFYRGGLPELSLEHLYAFIPLPEAINMHFLGVVNVAADGSLAALLAGSLSVTNLLFALVVGVTQFVQIRLTLPPLPERKENATMQEDFARSMQLNMRYVLPMVITVASYFLSVAVSLYWVTSNLFAIGQEFYVRRRVRGVENPQALAQAIAETK